jgi:hypothetical protein
MKDFPEPVVVYDSKTKQPVREIDPLEVQRKTRALLASCKRRALNTDRPAEYFRYLPKVVEDEMSFYLYVASFCRYLNHRPAEYIWRGKVLTIPEPEPGQKEAS